MAQILWILFFIALEPFLAAQTNEVKTYDNQFNGVIGRTVDESEPAWREPLKAKKGSPNVILIVLDDVGFAQLGAFGGLINTPNLDKLAGHGLRYNNFHTTALCSPTRSSLLTGRNHHSNHMGSIAELSTGFPGYDGQIPFENGFLSEVLLGKGYATFAVGKWHLAPDEEMNMGARKDRWPLGRGFERYYGFLGGDAHQYYPNLTYDNHFIDPPKTFEEGYHFSEDINDKAIEFIGDLKAVAPDKPFFLYYAPGAMHAPHHVRPEWIQKYKGKFDMGWDQAREIILKRQKELGIVPANTQLAPRNKEVKAWDSLSDKEKHLFAYMMEIFAGMLEHTDHQIGLLINYLASTNQLDNTLIIVVSDNGASAEGEAFGLLSEGSFFNAIPEDVDYIWENRERLGGPDSFNHYPHGWTMAGNTPFKKWKREVHLGGITDPLIVFWPAKIKDQGKIRSQYTHAIDILPTVLELLNIEFPKTIKGYPQSSIEGFSFANSIENEKDPSKRQTQYYEMFGYRSIYHNGWTAVSPHLPFGTPMTEEVLKNTKWELYNTEEDFSQSHNLADQFPEKVKEMNERWWVEAGKYNVLPLDGRANERIITPRPQLTATRKEYVYYPNSLPITTSVAAPTLNRSFHILAEVVIPQDGAEGVLIAHGGNFGGWSFYIKDGKLHFTYNYVGRTITDIVTNENVPVGDSKLEFKFTKQGSEPFGAGGLGELFINGQKVAEKEIPKTNGFAYWPHGEGLTPGYDNLTTITPAYRSPFKFTGKIKRVVME